MKKNDVYKWRYKSEYLNTLRSNYPYHCKSCIGVFDGERLKDTFWSGGSETYKFSKEEIEIKLDIELIANFDDLVNLKDYEADSVHYYYDKSDIIDLNHPNSSRGNMYLKKGAERSLDRMKHVLERHLKFYEDQVRQNQRLLKEQKEAFGNLKVDDYLLTNSDVYLGDL